MQWGAEIQWSSTKPDLDVGKQSGQTAIHPEPGIRHHGSSENFTGCDCDHAGSLFFDIDVVDEELGIVSGKKWLHHNSQLGRSSQLLFV